jgi:hypothetical protein
VVVVEAFCDKEHLLWVLEGAGLRLDSPELCVAWLECKLETSLRRKREVLPKDVIEHQHGRYAVRFRPHHERVFDTDELAPAAVASRLLKDETSP